MPSPSAAARSRTYPGQRSDPSNRHARMYPSYRRLLGPTAYLVLGTLRERIFDDETRLIDYSWLVNETGLAYSTVSKAIKELVTQGLIMRERPCAGRGHIYQITMLPPPEKRQATSAPIRTAAPDQDVDQLDACAAQTITERSPNDHVDDLCENRESPTPKRQSAAFFNPPMNHENHKKKKKRADSAQPSVACRQRATPGASVATNQPDSMKETTAQLPSPEIMPPPDLQPHQVSLFEALCRENAAAVAEEIVRARPDLTAADLAQDLQAARLRPAVQYPIGLVCRSWLGGGRVAAPRSRPGEAAVPEGGRLEGHQPPVPSPAPRRELDGVSAAPPEEEGQEVASPTEQPPEVLWAQALNMLRLMMPRPEFDVWLRGVTLLRLTNGRAVVGCPGLQHKERLENHYAAAVRRVLSDVAGLPVEVRFILVRRGP